MRWTVSCGLCALIACIPDFGLEDRTFGEPDAGFEVGSDAAEAADAADTDAGQLGGDTGVVFSDAEVKAEICNNGLDDDDNGVRDCRDPACGETSCDDDNVCTINSCSAAGDCELMNDNTVSGPGWRCAQGIKTETTCSDGEDNDVDGFPDCTDEDCPECALTLLCCPSTGACLPICE